MNQTGDSIANEVLLSRNSYSGPVLLLEGDTDEKFFRRFVENSDILIIPSWNKENVLDAVEILESDASTQGFLGIVDADFDHIDNSVPTSGNVVVTDYHDLEMMIIKTQAFNAVLLEYGSQTKIKNYPSSNGILHDLLDKAVVLGHLRHLSLTQGLNLRFEGLRFSRFVDRKSLKMDMKKMIGIIFSFTGNPTLESGKICNQLSKHMDNTNHDPYQICCGHDFVSILSIALRKVLGTQLKETVSPDKLRLALRLAYDSSDFLQTKLYSDAKQWEKRNQGYDIF